MGDAENISLEDTLDDFGFDSDPEPSLCDFERVAAIYSAYMQTHPDFTERRTLYAHILCSTETPELASQVPDESCILSSDYVRIFDQVQSEHLPRILRARQACDAQIPHTTFCNNCTLKIGYPKFCAKCGKVSYCDKKCQKMHWQEHKRVCGTPDQPSEVRRLGRDAISGAVVGWTPPCSN